MMLNVAASLPLLLTVSWLSIGIQGNPNDSAPIGAGGENRQLTADEQISRRRLMISDGDGDDPSVIDRHRLGWRFHFHPRLQQHSIKTRQGKILGKRSADPDIRETDAERQSRGESSTDGSHKIPDDNKVTAVENGLDPLSETVNSLLIGNQTNNNYTKFWGVAKSIDGNEDFVSFQESPLSLLPEAMNETMTAQFFGITNIYVGGQKTTHNQLIDKKQSESIVTEAVADCPVCPPIVAAVECPTTAEHVITTVTACESFGSSLGTCSVASIAPSGTIFVLFTSSSSSAKSSSSSGSGGGRKSFGRYLKKKNKNNSPTVTVATAVIGVVATAPNTKVKITCPYIPTDVTVTTQNGPVLPYKPREEAGFIQLIVTGTLTLEKYTMACVWSSSP